MSAVIPNNASQLEDSSSKHPAPKKILKHTYELVLGAIQSDKKIILITGDAKKGKTALIHTISKDLSTKHRIINLSGKDLPELDSSNNTSASELSLMKDFILESTDLEDKLVVTLDDADCLPISFLTELTNHAKNSSPDTHHLQLVLSGPMTFKDQLLAIDEVADEDLTHYPMDSLSEEFIHNFAKDKTYKISSNIKRIVFKPEALHALSEFIQNDKQLLDVVLEWCAALVKKDQLPSITSHTISRAAGFAQQFSKDKDLRLSNSYPPSHEVYKYINDIQSAKKAKRSSTEKIAKSATSKATKKTNKNKRSEPSSKPFIETKNSALTKKSKIPTITSKVENSNIDAAPLVDEDISQSLRNLEEEIPMQRAASVNQTRATDTKSFPAMAGLIGLLLLGFITFIAMRIGSDPVTDPKHNESVNKTIASNNPQENVPENLSEPVSSEPKETSAESNKKIITQTADKNKAAEQTKPNAGIVASDVKKPAENKINEDREPLAKKPSALADNKKTDKILPSGDAKSIKNDLAKKSVNTPENKAQITKQKDKNIANKPVPAAEVNNLLALANYQFENKQLSTPPGDNALETYQKILVKYPGNKAAKAGVKKVHDKYMDWANYYLKQNEVKRAKHFYNKALVIEPKNAVALANLQNIERQETGASTEAPSSVVLQDDIPASVIENLMVSATKKMQQIENDIKVNKRNYRIYQEAQTAYQDVLRSQPQNKDAVNGLSLLRKYYSEWAELQIQSQNYNIALFLYGQALSIEPGSQKIAQRIEQIRELKKTL